MLGDQMLQRIEFVHNNSFLHRDIKPDNFLMGSGNNSHILYIIDFGLSKRFIDPRTGEHIPYRDGKSLTGTARYASLNTHIGQEQSRRDDIESIAFVMVYFLKGKLPWQGVIAHEKEDKYKKIKEKKIDTPITELASGLPPQFLRFFELVRNIGFEDAPDYIALRTLLAEMFNEKGYQNDFKYDWILEAKPELLKKNRYHSQNQVRPRGPNNNKKNLKNRGNSKGSLKQIHEEDGKVDEEKPIPPKSKKIGGDHNKNYKKTSRQYAKEDYDAHPHYKSKDHIEHNNEDLYRKTYEGFRGKGKNKPYFDQNQYAQEGEVDTYHGSGYYNK